MLSIHDLSPAGLAAWIIEKFRAWSDCGGDVESVFTKDELLRLGARPGCAVTIGDMTFDWEPQTPAGMDVHMSGRGTDTRLEQTDRVSADERKAARKARRESDDGE